MKKTNNNNTTPIKERKIFLNNMNTWFSNFIIEAMRTEAVTDPRVMKNDFMGTLNTSNMKLPYLFTPKITKINYNCHFEHEVFTNDAFIYNLEEADTAEIEYIIKGLKALKYSTEKILVIVSNIMTWGKTAAKYKEEELLEDGIEENYTFEDQHGEEDAVVRKKEVIVRDLISRLEKAYTVYGC
jgi:hypothetical protein